MQIDASIYLSKKETCSYLHIANNTLDKWIVEGLPRIEIGGVIRFDKREIDKWLIIRSHPEKCML